jgi:ribonuclease-3
MPQEISKLEKKLGIKFKNEDLLVEALTHRSYLNEYPRWRLPHNERLEYLGDAVLELVVSEELFKKFPNYPEGQLTVLRAALVNYQILAKVAEGIGLDDFVLLSRGEKKDEGKAREVILANAIEAVIGAIYLDQGLTPTRNFTRKFVMVNLDTVLETKSYKDAKSELQEIIQEKLRITPTYRVLGESGPAHKRIFKIGVYFGEEFIAEGNGASKQEAELEAAKEALKKRKIK